MKMIDEIIKRVHNLSLDHQKEILESIRFLQAEEQRKYHRLQTKVPIDAVVGDRVIQADTQDISATGIYQ